MQREIEKHELKAFTALEHNRPSYRTRGTPKPDNPRKSGMFGCNLTPDGFFFKYGKTVTEIKFRSEESDMPLSSFISIQSSHLNVYGNGGQVNCHCKRTFVRVTAR